MGLFGIGSQLLSGLSRLVSFYLICSLYSSVSSYIRLAIQPACAVAAVLNQTRSISLTTALSNVRCHFPRPSEIKRIKRHGWKTRLSTLEGRKTLMRRILKGRHVLSH